jgi:hypothetical protein
MCTTTAKFTVKNSLLIVILLAFILPVLVSCGKNSAVAPSTSTTKLLVVNASPDVLPLYIFIGNLQLGTSVNNATNNLSTFKYPTPSTYYSVYSGPQTTRIANYKNATLFSFNDTLQTNVNYSLYFVGLATSTAPADAPDYIFTADTSAIPTLGSGKVRFINTSARTTGLDVYANGTLAFNNVLFKGVSKYIQLPAGIYSFKINPTGTPASVLTTLPNITVQDGRLYTLFTYGLVGRTDSAAFTAAVITNK